MKEIIIDNEKYFAYSEKEMSKMNEHTNKFYEQQGKLDVKSDFPKIITFRILGSDELFVLSNNKYVYYETPDIYYTLDKMLFGYSSVEDGYVEIYQVAVSENEIYTLGDNVKYKLGNVGFVIDNFFLRNDNVLLARSKDNLMVEDVTTIEKHDYRIIGITEDGVNIYEGDFPWVVSILNNYEIYQWDEGRNINGINKSYNNSLKFFSTKEIAEKWVKDNKPFKFITDNNVEITDSNQYIYGVCTKANWQTGEYLVWKLKRGRDNQHSSFNESSWKFFSTKEARDKYKDDNMPRFSKNEIIDAIIYAKRNYSKCTIIPETEFREKLDI